MSRRILISELFGPVVQGEGALIVRPTLFVRTGGCDYRCSWCDTLYAVLPEHKADWMPMTAEAILAQLHELSGGKPMLVTLSGGNPALQPLEPLIDLGHAAGYSFAMETQGSVARDWFAKLDYMVLSPKPPSSQMPMKWAQLEACINAARSDVKPNRVAPNGFTSPQVSLKVVVFDETDYQFARRVSARHPDIPCYLQVGNPSPASDDGQEPEIEASILLGRLRWLSERVLSDSWHNVTILPQLHVLIYGNQRGV